MRRGVQGLVVSDQVCGAVWLWGWVCFGLRDVIVWLSRRGVVGVLVPVVLFFSVHW